MRSNLLIVLLFLLLLGSCKNQQDSVRKNVYEHTIQGEKAELIKLNQFVIKEDSTSFIGNFIRPAKTVDKNLVIADYLQPALYFINKSNGNIIKKIRWKKGRGPGEVIKISDFDIVNGRIYISDMGNFRWSVFDTSGNFIKSAQPFYNPKKIKEIYAENPSIIENYKNKFYVSVIDIQYNRELQQSKSKAIAVLDTSLKINKVFGYMDAVYSKFRIYYATGVITVDENGSIYYSQRHTYKIYKYDNTGRFIKVFGIKGKFREINENITANLSYEELKRKWMDFSETNSIFSSPQGYVFFQFDDMTEKIYITKSWLDRIHYLKVYDTNGNYIPSDIKLPGWLIAVDNEGKLYIYENDEPGNRIVGVYELKIIKE